jgi:hypothetical protein
MKIPTFSMLFIIILLIVSCEKEHNENKNEYKILSGACGTISFVDDIGKDFSTARDSLISIRKPFIGNDYIIEEVEMEIDYNNDNRDFKGIIFRSGSNQTLIISMEDVLDSFGNYYFINWCPD